MTSKEWHTVNGTLFGFPELPREEDMTKPPYSKFLAERAAILEKAAAVKFKPAPKHRAFKGPKPGNGEFSPKASAPGSRVAVTVCVTDRNGVSPVKVAEVEHVGCVMFPAPRGGVWVSLWDGRMPVETRLNEHSSTAIVHMGVAEYEERFGPLAVAA